MGSAKIPEFAWGGLNTKAQATGLPLLDCVVLQDMRVAGTDLVQRLGCARVGLLTGNASASDLDGVNEHWSNIVDPRVWALGLYWTVKVLIELDVTSGTQGIVCVGHTTPAMIFDVTGGNVRFRVWDSAGTLTTITMGAAVAAIQSLWVTRSGATLTTKINNGTSVTGSMSATLGVRSPVGDLRVGRNDGTDYMDGTFDRLTALSIVEANDKDRLVRLPNPRAEYVLCDMDFNESAGGLAYDRSRYENHLIAQNTPTEIASLCHNPAPIRALSMNVDTETNRKQVLCAAGGRYYIGGVE